MEVINTAILGNTDNIKKEVLHRIEDLPEQAYPRDMLLSSALADELAYLTEAIHREIAVYLDRYGKIREVMVGDTDTVPLLRSQTRRGQFRLSGIRCIHTHPGTDSTLSAADLTSLREYRLDAMAAIGVLEGQITGISIAVLSEPGAESEFTVYGPLSPVQTEIFPFLDIVRSLDRVMITPEAQKVGEEAERAILIGFKQQITKFIDAEGSLQELRELALTAGALVVSQILISKDRPDPGLYLGKGKVKELALLRQAQSLDLMIFDDELTPRQQNNLEEQLGCRVIDRTALILQIFADRARTREGKLQVELAQLNYLLPRLVGIRSSLSRLGGGIGTRGPGETKLETDRRRIRKRITDLQEEIDEIKLQRGVLRKQRQQHELPVVALVGYTNAGKSTLMNTLTSADVLAENKLFATLDPTTRQLKIKNFEILLTDTVGFIHKLPTELVAAFRATLEEIKYADLLVHVVDASTPYFAAQIQAVNEVLQQLEVLEKPIILAFNKIDLVSETVELSSYLMQHQPALFISAQNSTNVQDLLELIAETLPDQPQLISLHIPFSETALMNKLFENGNVLETEYKEDGIYCTALLKKPLLSKVQKYIIIKE